MQASIKKTDKMLQVVYGEVYIPGVPDAHNEYMTAETVREMAYNFMRKQNLLAIDTQHDNVENGCCVVESFIVRAGDTDFIEGSWVIAIHVPDSELWDKIVEGELNGFSLEALVIKDPDVIELEIPEFVVGETEGSNGHAHTFKVFFGASGEFLGGETSVVNGHSHLIAKGTVTQDASGHSHRFSFWELIV